MICKKCETAVENKNKICSNCGSSINNNGKWKIAAVVLAATAVVLILVISNREGNLTLTPSPEPTPLPQSEAPITPEPLATPPAVQKPLVEEAPTPESHADLEKPMEEVWEILDESLKAINSYYDNYSQTVAYLSKNGYLYEDPSRSYVFIKDMEGLIEIDEKYLKESVMFFFLKPIDLAGFSSLRVTESEELKIFTGYETNDGFAITGSGEQGGIIAREDLKAVLGKYSWEHGNIVRIPFDSDTFEKTVKALSQYTAGDGGFDIRYMYRDDKYICVVASPKGKPTEISQFILEDTGDIIKVKIENTEKLQRHKKAINDLLPDLNQELLPAYELSLSLKYLKEDFGDIVEAMKSSAFITDNDMPLSFSSGTSDYVYMEFESGKKFVGHLEQSTWKMYPVDNDETARELMWAMNKRAPVFIVKQY